MPLEKCVLRSRSTRRQSLMLTVNQLLHLHPLTLEDILQQDPREKLELFPRLGYYFIVFRAIESRTTRERFQREDNTNECAGDNTRHDEGVVGEANVYLVVFNEGICSVSHSRHFRSSSRLTSYEQSFTSRISRVSFADFPIIIY